MQRVMQRLLAQPVSRQQQRLAPLVVQSDGKHATQLGDAIRAHLFVEMDDHFRIRVGVKLVAAAFQLRAQLEKVVDLAVEYATDAAVFVVDGLPAAGEIDDAQPAHAQAYVATGVDAFIVGSAVNNSLAHAMNVVCLHDIAAR